MQDFKFFMRFYRLPMMPSLMSCCKPEVSTCAGTVRGTAESEKPTLVADNKGRLQNLFIGVIIIITSPWWFGPVSHFLFVTVGGLDR